MADESKLEAQAREWLEANTALRWCTEPQEGDPVDEPIENLNRRPQQWADRLAAFADEQVKAETADLRDRLEAAEIRVGKLEEANAFLRKYADDLDQADRDRPNY